tara:strand:+ start:230 stop:1033 length:804 start_codon:yes stop_codon:yes gene_type:complete
MGLWGKSTSAESRPKFLSADGNATGAGGSRQNAFATTGGWALRPGLAMSGNDNTSADPEILVAIGGLSSTMGEANLLSVGWDSNTSLAHAGEGRLDIYFNCDEALTVTSAAWSASSSDFETNQWYFNMDVLGPTDMVADAGIVMQYYAGSGTNRITFRGVIPAAAVSGARFAFNATGATSRDCEMITNGTAAVVDGNGTTVTWADQKLFGSSAAAGVDHSSAVWGTDKYNSELWNSASGANDTQTLETVTGSSSGSSATVLTSLACV